MANNVTVKDAAGANQTFNTLYDSVSGTHRSQVIDNLAVANAYVTNSNPVPTQLIYNSLDSSANLITWTTANTSTSPAGSANQVGIGKGAIFYLTVTAGVGATANAQLTVNNIDPVSGKLFPVLVSVPVAANAAATFMYQVYPGITSTANVNVGLLLSRTWCANVTVTATGANTSTGCLNYTSMG